MAKMICVGGHSDGKVVDVHGGFGSVNLQYPVAGGYDIEQYLVERLQVDNQVLAFLKIAGLANVDAFRSLLIHYRPSCRCPAGQSDQAVTPESG